MAEQSLLERFRNAVERKQSSHRFDWSRLARPEQRLPTGHWRTWLILAGRGWGKTLCGAQTCRTWSKHFPSVNIIGATADDCRDVMVEGPSGILAICPDNERPQYFPAKRSLEWPSGCKTLIFSADEPERLRGKQSHKLWADELASWRYQQEAWDQAMFGLRLGANPQVLVTTTPKPTRLLRDLKAASTTYLTTGSTFDNRQNLAPAFFSDIIVRYQGTRLGRQELNAELLEDNPGALFHLENIEANRVTKVPELSRVVVAIDPATTSGEDSDETGIVACGINSGTPPHFYVIADLSLKATPDAWARRAVTAYHDLKADRIVGEQNNGGDMIPALLRHVDQNVSYRKVVATRGKAVRGEPTAALYEQGRVHHVGVLGALEDQMCEYDPMATARNSPDRMDALVWAMTELSSRLNGNLDFVEFMKRKAVREGWHYGFVSQQEMHRIERGLEEEKRKQSQTSPYNALRLARGDILDMSKSPDLRPAYYLNGRELRYERVLDLWVDPKNGETFECDMEAADLP